MFKNTYSGSYGFIGGICGNAYSGSTSAITIKNCYNIGDVTSNRTSDIAGILGCADYTSSSYKNIITNCYNIGKCLTESGSVNSGAYGITYNDSYCKISNCYYLKGTGKSNTGATELTAGQIVLKSSYTGFDFDTVWQMNTNAVYPYPQLQNNLQNDRVITEATLYTQPNKTVFIVGQDLDMSGCTLLFKYSNADDETINVTNDMVTGYNPKIIGEQTLTISYNNRTFEIKVNVEKAPFKEIRTVLDLYNIRYDLSSNYILMNDIDLTDATALGGDYDFGGRGWNPIGSDDVYGKDGVFSGEFDGNGHSIIGMRIEFTSSNKPTNLNSKTYYGLFANVSGKIYNLNIENVNLHTNVSSSSYDVYLGTIAAYTSKTAEIINCGVSGKIVCGKEEKYDSCSYVGGLVSYNYGTIKNCNNATKICAYCSSGIVHQNYGTIEQCYNTAQIFGNTACGICYDNNSNSIINNCYNSGLIIGSGSCGIALYNSGKLTNCYNVGSVKTSATDEANSGYAISSYSVTNCYYLNDSGKDVSGAIALTETQMKIQSMYKGFDFENVWILNEFANYPYPQLKENIQDINESAKIVSIIAIPQKTEYLTDDTLDFTGGMVKVVYVSGKEELIDITDSMVSGFDMSTSGEQTVTVTVAGASDTYTVNVAERPIVESVAIENQPNRKEFAVGTAFDFTGATAKISYVGGATETVDITYEMTTGGNINHIGKQTITYTYKEKSATFEVEVVGISLEKIEITQLPEKLNYIEGQSLDLTGMVVTAVMNNGIKSTLASGYTVSGYSDQIGEHTVTVSYLGKTVAFNVNVAKKTLLSLKLNSLPDKTEYISGESFDKSGIQVVATYDNGEICVVEDYTVSGFDATPGIKNVIISLDGKSVSFAVKVIARVVTEFKLTSLPSKLDYIEYESFDTTGLKAEATYNDGSTEDVTDYELSGFSSNVGTHTVMVAYKGFVKSFDITVSPRELVDVKVTAPTKTTYIIGEQFDYTGMKVVAVYNNGQEFEIDSYTMTGFDSLSAGAKEIVITYGGITRKFAVTVAKKSVVKTDGSIKLDSVKGRLGETVEVPVTITKNTGVTAMCHTITFNPNTLKFVSATAKNGFANGTVVVNDEKAANGEVTVLWFQATDVVESGVAYTLKFEILETAQDGNSSISIAFDENDNGNASGENVVFEAVNGGVEVLSYWLGDLDGDRKYGMADLLQLAQYVSGKEMTLTEKQKKSADVNEDGVINVHDVTLLSQWLLTADM